MNTKLNLINDKLLINEVNNMYISENLINKQSEVCNSKFDIWQSCINKHSWNDVNCVGKYKPDYELCIRKRNLMQNILEDQD